MMKKEIKNFSEKLGYNLFMGWKKLAKTFIIFILISSWLFTGWPVIWQNPRIPPEVKEAKALSLEYVGGTSCTGTSATYSCSLTSLTGGSGSSPQEGDLVIVVTGWASTADGDPGVNTTGYTEVADLYGNDTRDANLSVNWKIMGSTPDTSVTVRGFNNAANGGATVIHVWRNANSTTPMDVTPTTATGKNGAYPDSPSITASTSGAYVLTVGLGTGDTTPQTFTAPTGYGNAISVAGAGSTMSAIAVIASKAWTSGAEDPGAWGGGESTTSDSWAAASLAIKPKILPADLSWVTGDVNFKIYQSSSLTWGAGTLVCSGTLTDDNTQTITCSGGSIQPNTQYRVDVLLKNVGETSAGMQGTSEYVDHKFVKGGWAGSNPTLGSCDFYDAGGDDYFYSCSVTWNATNDVRITQSSTVHGSSVTISGGGTEGFMYLITTDSDVPSSNSNSYMDASIDSVTEDSSKITISASTPSISITISDGTVEYGIVPKNTAKTTLSSDMPPSGDMQTVNYDTNVTVNINIKGNNASGGGCTWTLASSNGSDQYVHQFCNATDSSCSSPPTNYTSLTTNYQTLKSGVSGQGSVNFHLRLITPTESSCYGQQSVNVDVQAAQP